MIRCRKVKMPRGPKFCSYHRNHGVQVPEAGHHGKCEYKRKEHIEICEKGCKKSCKILDRARNRYRQAKSVTEDVINSKVDVKFDNSAFDSLNSEETETLSFQELIEEFKVKVFVPGMKMLEKNLVELEDALKSLDGYDSRIKITLQYGMLVIVCPDNHKQEWVLNALSNSYMKLNDDDIKIHAVTEKDLWTKLRMYCFVDDEMNIQEFLTSVQYENKFVTNKWSHIKITEEDQKYRIEFSPDWQTTLFIYALNFTLKIREKYCEVKFIDEKDVEKQVIQEILQKMEGNEIFQNILVELLNNDNDINLDSVSNFGAISSFNNADNNHKITFEDDILSFNDSTILLYEDPSYNPMVLPCFNASF